MDANVLVHVASMLNDRLLRARVGFGLESCRLLALPPCTLRIKAHFEQHLKYLCLLRSRRKSVQVYDKAKRCKISVGFNFQQYVGFGRENIHYMQTWLQVCTKVTVRVMSAKLLDIEQGGSQLKSYYADPFTGECVLAEVQENSGRPCSCSFSGMWQILVKPKHGHLYPRTNLFP